MNGLTWAGRRRSTTFVLVAAIALVALATVFSTSTVMGLIDGKATLVTSLAFDSAAWEDDRHEPGGWTPTANEVTVEISGPANADYVSGSCFTCTEGRKHALDAGAIAAEVTLHTDAAWANIPVRAGLWTEADGTSSYGIIEFVTGSGLGPASNASDETGIRLWDTVNGTWDFLESVPVSLGETIRLGVMLDEANDEYDFYVDQVYVGSTKNEGGETALTHVFVNHYNYSTPTDPGTANGSYAAADYTVEWSDLKIAYAFGSIQDAVDAASDGDTIIVGSGVYNENVNVNKDVTIDGSGEALLEGSFSIVADNVTIQHFGITNPDGTFAIAVDEVDGTTIQENSISEIGSGAGAAPVQAIYAQVEDAGIVGLTISDNKIDDIGRSDLAASNKAILIGDSSANGTVTGLSIIDNEISELSSDGKGAYGILINVGGGAGLGSVTSPTITGNIMHHLEGGWVHGISLDGPTPGAEVSDNKFEDLTPTGSDVAAIFFDDNPDSATVNIEHNQFNSGVAVGLAIHADDLALGRTAMAEDNWWGHPSGPTHPSAADAGTAVDFNPWCTNQACTTFSDDAPPDIGGGGGGAAPSDELPAEGTIEDTGIDVPVEGGDSAEVEDGFDTSVEAESSDGSNLDVAAPDGSLPDGTTLAVWAIDGIEDVLVDAPAPEGADIVLGFVVQALDEDGNEVEGPFDPPLELVLTIPADQVPAGLDLDHVVLVAWNGEEWVEVEAVGTLNPDGSLTLVASVDHLTIFAAAFQELTGVFTPEPAATGTSLATWGGGTFEQVDAALAAGDSIWVFVDGVASGYTVGGPDFVNAKFTALYPGGMPAGTIVIVAR